MLEKTEGQFTDVLNRRAKNLAKPIAELEAQLAQVSLLEFSMLGQRYAVSLESVLAVTRVLEITPIPLVPKHITGIIRRRGDSIALVSLPYFFNASRGGISDADFAVIVQVKGKRFALQVEEIIGVTALAVDSLKPPQDNFDPTQISYISKVTLDGLMVVSLDALIDAEGFVVEKYSN